MPRRLAAIAAAGLTFGAAGWLALTGGPANTGGASGAAARSAPGPIESTGLAPAPASVADPSPAFIPAPAALQRAVDLAMSGRQGAAVLLDARSGRLLASHRLDLAARSLVRPGSTVKPFVLAALLERGLLPPAERILCRRQVRIGGRDLDCSHPDPGRPIDGAEALAYSCNWFFAHAASRLRPADLAQALRGAIPSTAGLADGEAAAAIDVARSSDELRLQALGESGIRVTPLAMLAAYRRLLAAPAIAPAVKAGLEGAAAYGSARLAQPDGMRVAGKTGTATGLESYRRNAWFIGAAPAGRADVVAMVFLEQGRGGADAAPVAGEIFAALRPPPPRDSVTVRRHWTRRAAVKPVEIAMDEYVAAVLAGEVSGFRSAESLKAMAVLIRGYAQVNRGRHRAEGFDFCDTTHCQDYRESAVQQRFRDAVAATRDEILWYGGAAANVFYHADCGGTTEAPERVWPGLRLPYLQSRPDPYCTRGGVRQWRAELRKDDLSRALAAGGLRTPDPLSGIEVASRSPVGRAGSLRMLGTGAAPVAASSFRFAVGRTLGWDLVRSTWFEVHDAGDRLVFQGRGAGHGVGLCQTGAARMGEEGLGYRDILQHFFPGTEAAGSPPPPEWLAAGGERTEVLSTHPSAHARLAEIADQLVRELEQRLGAAFPVRPQLRVYPSAAAFRDALGEPGWVAASTRGRVIRMQPPRALGEELRNTLRHELLHVWIETRGRGPLPLWFREGLALHLCGPPRPPGPDLPVDDRDLRGARTRAQLDRAYAAARSRVRRLVDRFGEAAVLGWVGTGLPAEAH